MTGERGDGEFGDARTEALLRRFGEHVRDPRTGALFELPRDRSWLERPAEAAPAPARRLAAALAAAAALMVVAGVSWWLLARTGGGPPAIRAAHLASAPGVLRGEKPTEFRSGERIWLHFESDRDGEAFVGLIDSRGRLVRVTVAGVQSGPNAVGPFRLDDDPGTETLILITTAPGRTQELQELLHEADPGAAADMARRVDAIKRAFGDDRWNVATMTYRHLP